MFLPVAVKINAHTSTEGSGFGYDFSLGIPTTLFPVSVRYHGGSSFYKDNYGNSPINRPSNNNTY